MNKEKMAKRLRELRGEKTTEEVALACGITRAAVSQYENALRIPRDDVKIRLAEYFGKSVQEIFFCD